MRTLSQVLGEAASRFPTRWAVCEKDRRLSYRDLDEHVDRIACGLIDLGVGQGSRVALWMPNIAEWIIAYFAIARIGAVVVPMNTRYKSHEVRYILEDSEASALFMVDAFAGIDYVSIIDEIRDALPGLEHVIIVGEPGARMHRFEEILDLGEQHVNDDALSTRSTSTRPNENVFILYTSGTTGNPKGAMLSHHNMAENAKQVTAILHSSEEDVFLLAVPFFHCFGCVMGILGAITWGAAIVPMPIFKAEEALARVERERVSVLYGVPTMFVLELEEARKGKADGTAYDLVSLRTGIMAGAPCPVEVMRGTMDELGCNISIAYGLTETSPVITMTHFDDPIARRVETVGRALPGVDVKIVDEDRQELPLGETGELACRGYNVMLGYYKMPEKTAEIIDTDGWLYSGDLATLDEEGYVRIVGRKKDMLITGGFNVYPAEIEEYLFTHPKVQNVSVIGTPDNVMGEVAIAYIIPKEGEALDPQEIVNYCSGKIANFKVPRYVEIVEAFPMTQSGKVQKFRLRETARAAADSGSLVKRSPSKKR